MCRWQTQLPPNSHFFPVLPSSAIKEPSARWNSKRLSFSSNNKGEHHRSNRSR